MYAWNWCSQLTWATKEPDSLSGVPSPHSELLSLQICQTSAFFAETVTPLASLLDLASRTPVHSKLGPNPSFCRCTARHTIKATKPRFYTARESQCTCACWGSAWDRGSMIELGSHIGKQGPSLEKGTNAESCRNTMHYFLKLCKYILTAVWY